VSLPAREGDAFCAAPIDAGLIAGKLLGAEQVGEGPAPDAAVPLRIGPVQAGRVARQWQCCLGLPAGLAQGDGLLDDEAFFEPFRAFFSTD